MPVMDGFEVLAKLMRSPETEAIPIIMLTSIAAADREQDAYNLGVNHYICKPFEAANLESTIRVALREFRIAAGLDPDLEAVDGSSREASDENSDENSDESSGELSTVGGGSNPFNSANETGYITIGESLTALEKQLGGGIRQGTVTLMVGASGTGKSVLCQTMPLRPFRTATGWLISVLISPR